jgi:protein-L-isoaspartate(D-aspartate) O-methyltransferase
VITWRQYNIAFTDRDTGDHATTHTLAPALDTAQTVGTLHGWWFLRKDPWPLRFIADDPTDTGIEPILDSLVADGHAHGWTRGTYEPETAAFGGPAAMSVAHRLFHVDSRYRTTLHRPGRLGPRETFTISVSVLCRAAGLDQFEHGDVWSRYAALRPDPALRLAVANLSAKIWRLMTCDAHASLTAEHRGSAAIDQEWLAALERAGRALAELARAGQLQRGLRAVLTHHLLFLANRAGLSVVDQASLAHLAVTATFHHQPINPPISKVPTVTTQPDLADPTAEQLRSTLVDGLAQRGTARSPRVLDALRTVPREAFVPHVPVQQAYADDAVYTKNNTDGVAISAASQPSIVATMLEQLDLQPGQTVFEAGAGTGYNAALMARIVGDRGFVTTADVDIDLVEDARAHLKTVGVDNVEIVHGDGALGYPANGPYDRVVATVGAYEVPTAWLDQLAPGGRLLVPLRLRGTASRSIAFERDRYGWHAVASALAVFMPLRGIGDDSRRQLWLTDQRDVMIEAHKDQIVDPDRLAGVLDTPRREHWTGVMFPPEVSFEWMDLWLSCNLPHALMRMNIQQTAVDRGQVTPMFGWGSMATIQDQNLAYCTIRPVAPGANGGKLYEVGVIGHGPDGDRLAGDVADEIILWETAYRDADVQFTMPTELPDPEPDRGLFVMYRDQNPIVVRWT